MNLVINSQFRPFTYDEMVKPLVQYKEAYDRAEQDYSDLVSQTEVWKDIVNQETSPEAYAMYKGYSDQLNSIVDDFSKGMTLGNRRALLRMKRDYAKNITPIAVAGAAMKESRKYRQDVMARDSSAIFRSNPTSVDDFLHGKVPDETYVSGDKIMTRTAAKAEALGKAMFSDPQFKLILGKQQYQIMQANGATPEQLFKAISQDPDAIPYLSSIFKDEWDAVGADSYGANEQAAIRNAINTGMYAALAKPTYQFVQNGEYVNAAQRSQIDLEQQRVNIARQESSNRADELAIARGDKPQWTRGGISYYNDGKTEQYAIVGAKIDSSGKVTFRVKPGKSIPKPGGGTFNGGDTFVTSADPVQYLREHINEIEPVIVDDGQTVWGARTNIQVPGTGASISDPFASANAGL